MFSCCNGKRTGLLYGAVTHTSTHTPTHIMSKQHVEGCREVEIARAENRK